MGNTHNTKFQIMNGVTFIYSANTVKALAIMPGKKPIGVNKNNISLRPLCWLEGAAGEWMTNDE